ncbi:DsbA family protein [Limnobacter sp.]|uniref:DsbA family protein n=1 Tax=Limnobacter sp. TaxID=2003368 RepID=UPI0035117662
MSVKTLLMPFITQRMLSRKRLLAKRERAESLRAKQGRPHTLMYFHQVDDPYSALVVQVLGKLMAAYDVTLQVHLVSPPPDAAAPERDKLVAYSRTDATHLARYWGLVFEDPGQQPKPEAVGQASLLLLNAIEAGVFVDDAQAITHTLWQGLPLPPGPAATLAKLKEHQSLADRLRERLGHYLGGMLYYEGEWYWGIDRLYHLEERWRGLGLARKPGHGFLFPRIPDLKLEQPASAANEIDFFFSFRSPYSAIVAPRVFELARLTGVRVNLKFVLPMVMRGLPVPAPKRQYIVHDTAREAHARGIPFGRLNDPVGAPAERALAIMPLAIAQTRGEQFVLSFMQGVWAEGMDAGSDKGLRIICDRAGLDWGDVQLALQDGTWRAQAEANRELLFSLGLWGVPSFRVGNTVTWGQDRLWLLQQALLATPQAV